MKAFALVSLLLSTLMGGSADTPAMTPPEEICRLEGAVYIESVAAFADYRIFVEDVEGFADLVVFKEDTEGFATEPGHWYFTNNKGFADFTVYIEDVKGFSDFAIAYTDFRTAAGCK